MGSRHCGMRTGNDFEPGLQRAVAALAKQRQSVFGQGLTGARLDRGALITHRLADKEA